MSHQLPIPTRLLAGLDSPRLGRRRVYLDNACLTPAARPVAEAVAAFYRRPPGCALRSAAAATGDLEQRIRDGRDAVREWLNARFSDEIVFTANATLSINIVAGAFSRLPGAVLLTDLEHNSNRLPWLEQERAELAWPPGTAFPLDAYRELLRSRPIKLVSITGMSNVTGRTIPVREVIREAHDRGVPVHLDAAQLALHRTVNIGEDDPDLLSLSLHKAYGPSGLGVLYIRREMQATFRPRLAGGGGVDDHHDEEVRPTAGAARFEYGLQNYAAQCAVPETVAFLRGFERGALDDHFRGLGARARAALHELPGVRFIDGEGEPCSSILNFAIEGVDSRRLAELLDLTGDIQVRAGRMCAHHYYHRYGLPPSLRLSFGYHNTGEEVEHCVRTLGTLLQRYL